MSLDAQIKGSLDVKLRTLWTDEKQRWEESEKKIRRQSQRREEKRRDEKRREGKGREGKKKKIKEKKVRESQKKVRRKKIHVREKVGKSRTTAFFK